MTAPSDPLLAGSPRRRAGLPPPAAQLLGPDSPLWIAGGVVVLVVLCGAACALMWHVHRQELRACA